MDTRYNLKNMIEGVKLKLEYKDGATNMLVLYSKGYNAYKKKLESICKKLQCVC
jgi:hypothetical protein